MTGLTYPNPPRGSTANDDGGIATAASRLPRAALNLLLATFAVSGLATAVPAHAQEQALTLFFVILEGAQASLPP